MPKVINYKDWDNVEEDYANEEKRNKLSHKTKPHDKKEWKKVDDRLQKENNVKIVKNKRRKAHKNNNHNIS
jgi:hypothetical protein